MTSALSALGPHGVGRQLGAFVGPAHLGTLGIVVRQRCGVVLAPGSCRVSWRGAGSLGIEAACLLGLIGALSVLGPRAS